MNVDSILLADYARVGTDGKLDVVGVFNRIPANTLPATLPFLSLSLVVHGHSEEGGTTHGIELRLLNERREALSPPMVGEFDFPPASDAYPGLPVRSVKTFLMLQPTFPEHGLYAFEVYIDGTYHAAASFYVGPMDSPTS